MEFIRFTGGLTMRIGQEVGGMRDDVWRVQIRHTVKKHLDKELQLHNRGIKVLTLFFIDRVASYRDYDGGGKPTKGKFAEWFEEELAALAKEPRYGVLDWLKQPLDRLHNGYFAQDKKGVPKDTKGDTQADDDVYNLIMRDKEQLLSIDEPLRFIFSHSALREGWDNPNVFQICTLNETKSAVKKRQEIGRGLRLPVDQDGKRVFDEAINKLYVMANESYEDFARALQTEYEQDCGVTFGKVPVTALARITRAVDGREVPIGMDAAEAIRAALVAQKMLEADGRLGAAFDPRKKDFKLTLPPDYAELQPAVIDLLAAYQIERHIRKDSDEKPNRLKKEVTLSSDFEALWNRIKPKTMYRVEFETDTLATQAVAALKKMEKIEPTKIKVTAGRVEVRKGGVAAEAVSAADEQASTGRRALPDVLAYLQNETELTRSTLVRILRESGRLGEFLTNPQRFMDQTASILKYELHRLLVDGIKYDRIAGGGSEAEWEMVLFKNDELINVLTALQVEKSIYEYVPYDSEIEREFARKLDQRDDIRLFVKLPNWFKVDTPVGAYNPDWAIVKHDDETVYLVRETKGTKDFLKLRTTEADKVRCGQRHFEALGVPFGVATSADDV
jgi:type III restriction enzyme